MNLVKKLQGRSEVRKVGSVVVVEGDLLLTRDLCGDMLNDYCKIDGKVMPGSSGWRRINAYFTWD